MRSLSGRLLVLTVIFVMLAEVLIFLPSLARYRVDYLRGRLDAANIVAIAEFDSDPATRDPDFENSLLEAAGVRSVALRTSGARIPVLYGDWREPVLKTYMLDESSALDKIVEAVACMFLSDPDRVIRVIGAPDAQRSPMGDKIEITLHEGQLKTAMLDFAVRILLLSLIISLLTATLVFLSLNRWLVRPIRDLIASMTAFREAPEAAAIMAPGTGNTEIDEARRELSTMQTELRSALRQKTRLASLGEAVAKINHDLRNMLASAQILADRLETSGDPLVARIGPKLLRSLDRATTLCTQTLAFGKAEEPEPVRRRVMLAPLAEEVSESVMPIDAGARVSIGIEIEPDVYAEADPDQLFRVLQNLLRNAYQAIESSGRGGTVRVSARRGEGLTEIDVRDDGPGLPVAAQENLFKAFKGGARRGGSGLGLYISRELVNAHSGDLSLVESSTEGTWFRVAIPDTSGRETAATNGDR